MHPHLIPGLPIQTFGLCVAVGIMICWTLLERLSGRKDLGTLVFLTIAAGFVGARVAHVLEYWHADGFDTNFLAAFQIWNGGLVFYGGLVGAVLAFAVWCWVTKNHPLGLMDLISVVLPLGHAFGRLGCFFFGCCWGKVSDSALALSFPAHSPAWSAQVQAGLITPHALRSLPVLPTQLFESAALLVLFAGLYLLYRRTRGWTTAAYFCSYGILRFLIEFLRDDERPVWGGGLSSAQNVSLFLIAAGIAVFIWSFKRHGQSASDHR